MSPDRGRQRDRTGETNDVALLLLGALAQLDAFAAAAEVPRPQSIAIDDALVVAALGAISLRRSLRRWALHAAGEAPPASPPGPAASVCRRALR